MGCQLKKKSAEANNQETYFCIEYECKSSKWCTYIQNGDMLSFASCFVCLTIGKSTKEQRLTFWVKS